jgi:hypothetical protein
MGKITRKIKRGAKMVGSGVATVVGTVIGAELVFVGAQMAVNDGKHLYAVGKEIVDPTPIKVKIGFRKAETVKINPITGKVSAYTGNKTPAVTMSKKKFNKEVSKK